MNAPVLLFTYKRLDKLKLTVEALAANYLAKESDLFIFSDAAKQTADEGVVNCVRSYLKTISGFKNITIIEATKNKGLANSIISGVTEVMKRHEKVIVIEDDLRTTQNFLSYMNEALNFYCAEEKVFSVSGYSFNLGVREHQNADAYFLNRGWSWGWATWKDRWCKVDWEVSDYSSFRKDRKRRSQFTKGGSDLNSMLDSQMSGRLDSWAIRWFYSQFKYSGLTLYPVLSKVYNEGFDEDATHTNGSEKRYIPRLDTKNSQIFSFPKLIEVDEFYQKAFQRKMGIRERIVSKLRTLIKIFIR